MKLGQYIGLQDQLLHDIHVGDLVKDFSGKEYTIDRFGRAKPIDGSNECPVRQLKGCEVVNEWKPAMPEPSDEEEKELQLIEIYVHAAGEQRLVDELRSRGWTVTCSRVVEKIVYEEVAL